MEIWKDIIGYEGLYQISNLGNVKSHRRKGAIGKLLKPGMNRYGYLQVHLSKEGKRKMCLVHRLVWEAFNGPIPEGLQVNHIDENPENDCLENLNLMSPKANINWGTHNERSAKARTNGKGSRPVLQYTKEGTFIREWPSMNEVERQLGYSTSSISRCCRGQLKTAYKHIWRYLLV